MPAPRMQPKSSSPRSIRGSGTWSPSPAPEPFSGYDGQTELRTAQLLVPFPYDELYLRYLVMRIDLEQGELERYNNDAACFNRLWQSCAAHYGRTHEPLSVSALRF